MGHEHLLDAMIGTAAIGAIETIGQIPDFDYMTVGKLLLQILVAIGSLVTIFRKKTNNTNTNS